MKYIEFRDEMKAFPSLSVREIEKRFRGLTAGGWWSGRKKAISKN